MIDTSIDYEVLNLEHTKAGNELRETINHLVGIASAITFARSHFSQEDEWTQGDELISRICGPLEHLLCEIAESVVTAKTRQKAACEAISEYHKTKTKTNSEENQ